MCNSLLRTQFSLCVRLPTPWEWYMLGKNHIFVSFPPHLGIVNNFYCDFTKDEASDFILLRAVSI